VSSLAKLRPQKPLRSLSASGRFYRRHRKKCILANKEWYEKNRDRVSAYNRQRRLANPILWRALDLYYRAKRRAKRLKESKAWHRKNKQHAVRYRASHYAANRPAILAKQKNYRAGLGDTYVKQVIRATSAPQPREMPPALIEAKRRQLFYMRLYRELKGVHREGRNSKHRHDRKAA